MSDLNLKFQTLSLKENGKKLKGAQSELAFKAHVFDQKSLKQDIITFSSKSANNKQISFGSNLKALLFKGKDPSRQDIDGYLKDYDQYATTADLHNRLLFSYGDPSSMAQALADHQKRSGQGKDNLFKEVIDNMCGFFEKLKASNVIVVDGTKLTNFEFLNDKKFEQIKTIYLDILKRPELFNKTRFDQDKKEFKALISEEHYDERTKYLKHIIQDILPEILKDKTIVVNDPSDLHKVLTDEVVQALILDKLDLEPPPEKHDHDHHDHDHDHQDHSKHDHGHQDHSTCGHDQDKKPHHDHDGDDYDHDHKISFGCGGHNNIHEHKKEEEQHEHKDYDLSTPEGKLASAVDLLDEINEKFNITVASKVPKRFYDPLSQEKEVPEGYYDKKALGLRQEPKNFYEAQYLDSAAKKVKGYNPKNTVIVTPKDAAKDIVEKIKALNKEYLYIEDWLYKYCLGDQATKAQILDNLEKLAPKDSQVNIRELARDVDNYLNDYIKVYDINNPENNGKLNESMQQYGKINAMSEISRSYFTGVGEDAKDLVKMLLGLSLFGEVAEHASEALGAGFIINLSNTAMGVADSLTSACTNYLQWRNELGEEKAKEHFQSVVANVMTFALPTLFLKLSPEDGPLQHFIFRNASAVDAYSGVITTFTEYYNKLEELIEKGAKKVPEDVKDDPKKLAKWKLTEAWKAFTAHSLNRGQTMGIVVSQPFALAAQPIMKVLAPIGARPLLIAVAGTLECWTSSIYLLMDSANWKKFKNRLKKSLVKEDKAEMTPEKFMELRKSVMSKIVESQAGQAGLSAGLEIKDHLPAGVGSSIKKGYLAVRNVVSKVIATPLSKICMAFLDRKYNKMSEEEKKQIEGSKCCGGNH